MHHHLACPPSPTRRRSLPRRASATLLALGMALSAALAGAHAGDDAALDAVILPGGERMACRIVGDEAGWLVVEVGGRTYRFERARLEGVEREGEPALDEDLLEATVEWGQQLGSAHESVARGARAALLSLGTAAGPYLREAARRVDNGPAAADLRALAVTLEARGRQARLQEMTVAVGLRPLQEGGFAPPVLRYLEACARGEDEPTARAALEAALAEVLDPGQRTALAAWLDQRPIDGPR